MQRIQKLKSMPIVLSFCSLLFALCSLSLSPPAFAAIDIRDYYPLAQKGYTLGDYASSLVKASIIGAGLIAFLLFLGGGLTMITSAGNPQDQQKGKNAVTAGVMGLVLVVAAYWIVQIIEVITGVNILNPSL
jgi:hypothetical protein